MIAMADTAPDERRVRTIDKWILPFSVATFLGYSGFLLMAGSIYTSQAKDYEYTGKTVIEVKKDVEELKKSKTDVEKDISKINIKISSIEENQRKINDKLDRLIDAALQSQKKNRQDDDQ